MRITRQRCCPRAARLLKHAYCQLDGTQVIGELEESRVSHVTVTLI